MYKSPVILSAFILSSFAIKLMAQNPVNNDDSHYFNYDLHVTNGNANIYLEIYGHKNSDNTFKITKTDDKSFLNEFLEVINETDVLEDIWCDQFDHRIPENTPFEWNTYGNKIFTFHPVFEEDDDMVLGQFQVIVEVSTQNNQILSYHMKNKKTFSPAFATKVHSYEYKAACFPLLAHRNALKELTVAVKGKTYMYSYQEYIKRVYSDYKPSN